MTKHRRAPQYSWAPLAWQLQPVPDLTGYTAPNSAADGYAMQAALHYYLCNRTGGTVFGWNIDAKTKNMLKYLGVGGPAYGRVL